MIDTTAYFLHHHQSLKLYRILKSMFKYKWYIPKIYRITDSLDNFKKLVTTQVPDMFAMLL
jgi:hypothetical protein